ncbi:TrbC/VirB2 family protein [Pseudomonas putida]|uniref:TrbC/VirB2 family protein n=1 Tax=Pseudomonas putida TaxID=303 RepID=UPI00035CD9DB|nr:TrbC/VirB2 family protein [Pseudomonas putida]
MEKLKAMYKAPMVRKLVPAVAMVMVSGAAMAAEGSGGFDVTAFMDPIKTSLQENLTSILGVVGVIFAAYWGATSGIQIVRKFLSKATS